LIETKGENVTGWVELHLYYKATEKCLICAEKRSVYQWPSSVKLNESSTGCLRCLHEWLEYRNPASDLKPAQMHNGKPVLMLNASLAPRRRGAYECAHCGQTFYGIERLTGHRRNLNKARPIRRQTEYEKAARSIVEISNLIETAIEERDFNLCRMLAERATDVLAKALPLLEYSIIFENLEKLITDAEEVGRKDV
jgi:hypothetical protein